MTWPLGSLLQCDGCGPKCHKHLIYQPTEAWRRIGTRIELLPTEAPREPGHPPTRNICVDGAHRALRGLHERGLRRRQREALPQRPKSPSAEFDHMPTSLHMPETKMAAPARKGEHKGDDPLAWNACCADPHPSGRDEVGGGGKGRGVDWRNRYRLGVAAGGSGMSMSSPSLMMATIVAMKPSARAMARCLGVKYLRLYVAPTMAPSR